MTKTALEDGKGTSKIKKGDCWFTVENILWSDIETIIEIIQEEFSMSNFQKEEQPNQYGHAVSLRIDNIVRILIYLRQSFDLHKFYHISHECFKQLLGLSLY